MLKLRSIFMTLGGLSLLSGTLAYANSGVITASLSNNTSIGLNPGTHDMTVVFDGQHSADAFVGQINWYNTTGQLTLGLNAKLDSILVNTPHQGQTFSTYCIEGLQDVYFGATETWHGATGIATDGQNAVVALKDAPNPGTHLTSTGNPNQVQEVTEFWDRFHDSVTTNNEAAAFQLGIWEIVNDGMTDNFHSSTLFTSGNFTASGGAANDTAAISQALTWLGQLGASNYDHKYAIYALTDGNSGNYVGIQDQIFAVALPLPGALPAGLALLSGLAVVNFGRRRALR